MEKVNSFLALEVDPERLFERRTNRLERRRIPRCFDPSEAVPGIGRKQPRQVLWINEFRTMRQRPAKVLAQTCADFACEGARRIQTVCE